MHFPLCNLKEWTSVVYKVWADVTRGIMPRLKADRQTTGGGSAFVRPRQIFNKFKMRGIRQDALNRDCRIQLRLVTRRRVYVRNVTYLSARRGILPSERTAWNRLRGKWTRPKSNATRARIGRGKIALSGRATNFLMNYIFKCYY